MEELGSQLNSEKFPDARQRRFPGKVARLAQGGFVGCLVGFSREREKERRKFPWPRGLSSASRIEKRLSPRLPFPLPAFYSYSAAFTGAAWQPDGEARTLMIFFVARHSLRKLGRAPFTAFVFLPRRGRCRWS